MGIESYRSKRAAILRIVAAGFAGATAGYDFAANDGLTTMGTFSAHDGRRFRHPDSNPFDRREH